MTAAATILSYSKQHKKHHHLRKTRKPSALHLPQENSTKQTKKMKKKNPIQVSTFRIMEALI